MDTQNEGIMCLTCGQEAVLTADHTGNWDDYGHSDAAHYPNWYPHPPYRTEEDN